MGTPCPSTCIAPKFDPHTSACGLSTLREQSRTRARDWGACADGLHERVEFRCEDATHADLRDASVVYIYLLPRGIEQLQPALQQLTPGSRLVSYIFKVPFLEDRACERERSGIQECCETSSVVLAKPGRDRGDGEHSRIHIYRIGQAGATRSDAMVRFPFDAVSNPSRHLPCYRRSKAST